MEITAFSEQRSFKLFGASKRHDPNKSYGEEIRELLDRVWGEVRNKRLSHAGINHVVYEAEDRIFAGIELLGPQEMDLEAKEVRFQKYVYGLHTGPYSGLNEAHKSIRTAIEASGVRHVPPLMEIYGHWQEDESKLETEILYAIE